MTLRLASSLVAPLLLAALAQGCTKSPSNDTMTTSGAVPVPASGTKAGMPVGPSAQLAVPRSGTRP